MYRLLVPMTGWLVLVACTGNTADTTFVYQVDEPVEGRLDRTRCGTGVGLRIDLGIDQGFGYYVDLTGVNAFVAACTIDGSDRIGGCGILLPETLLDLDDGVLTGSSVARVDLTDQSECSGANLNLDYTLTPDDDNGTLTTHIDLRWELDNTFECEALELDVIAASNNGLGITGCEIDYDFEATKLAECRFNRAEPCRYE